MCYSMLDKACLLRIIIIVSSIVTSSCGGGGDSSSESEDDVNLIQLDTPSNLNFKTETNNIIMQWAEVPDATSYDIYFSDIQGTSSTGTKLVSNTNYFTHEGLEFEKTYYYTFVAKSENGQSSASDEYAIHTKRYSKLDFNGNYLFDQGIESSRVRWFCVLDHKTGLVWESKTSFTSFNEYGYYYGNNTGGTATGISNCFSHSTCTTEAYIAEVNELNYCGYNDWRLPEIGELESLINTDFQDVTIHRKYFPSTISSGYWSATPYAEYPVYAWFVDFEDGTTSVDPRSGKHIRLVRDVDISNKLVPQKLRTYSANNQIHLHWDPVLTARSYNIYWSNTQGTGKQGNLVNTISNEFTLSNADKNNTYYFVVTAVLASGEQAESIEIAGKSNDYTKLDQSGLALVDQSADYSATPWDCVLDNETGLYWETKSDVDGLRKNTHTYSNTTLYPTMDSSWRGTCSDITDVRCETESYIIDVNSVGLCGFNDWRLPTYNELLSITIPERLTNTINYDYFPHTINNLFIEYWTSTEYSKNFYNSGWSISYYNGTPITNSVKAIHDKHVRLVR